MDQGLVLTPDWVKTVRQLGGDEGWEAYIDGVAEEVANFFVVLCSERTGYSVGATYDVDGGMLKVVS